MNWKNHYKMILSSYSKAHKAYTLYSFAKDQSSKAKDLVSTISNISKILLPKKEIK